MEPLQKRYKEAILPEVMKKFEIANRMAVPNVTKLTINMGLGEATKDSSIIEKMHGILRTITGQLPVPTKSRQSIANFNLRQGDVIGLKVTLRRDKMWYFIDKLAHVVLPQVKDFRGISERSFDQVGNYTLALEDFLAFPEIDPAKVNVKPKGLSITFSIANSDKEKSKYLLEKIGFVFNNMKESK